MQKYIRNLIHRKDVTVDCDIINNFEEKIKVFKSVKNYANTFIKLLDEPYTNHIFFKQIERKYEFDKPKMCSKINLKLVIAICNKRRSINLVLFTSDTYNTNYEECINIHLTNDCKIKSFRSSKHDLDLIPIMFNMLLAEYNRIYEIGLARENSYKLLTKSKSVNYIQEYI